MSIYTVGHSILSQDEFLAATHHMDIIMDIRSHPGSVHPHFRKEQLEVWLPQAGREYLWEPRLGGWAAKHLGLAAEFAKYGVDLSAYAQLKFPKQRIRIRMLFHQG